VTEKEFQQGVLDWARINGWLAFHAHDSRRSQPGFPDLTLVRGGLLMFVELKTASGRVSPAQQQWLAALSDAGCEVHVWRPGDWGEIERVLARRAPAGRGPR
jgi:VRR-NUC domain